MHRSKKGSAASRFAPLALVGCLLAAFFHGPATAGLAPAPRLDGAPRPGTAAEAARPGAGAGIELVDFVRRIEQALPPGWHVVEKDIASVPIGWTGEPSALYVMVEDTKTRFFHPSGFYYYSFYRVWVVPQPWEGEMRSTPYIADSVPAFLLGANGRYIAFYHTAGGNVWEDGPAALCRTLDLGGICHTEISRRIVDVAIERKLVDLVPDEESSGFKLVSQRIIGLAGDGPNLYMEYLFPEEGAPGDTLAMVTREVAGSVFELIPEVETLYLRRCTSQTFTDTIVTRN
jgi:hypothetical protein